MTSLIKLISSFLSKRKFSWRWNVYAKRHTRWAATRFHPVPTLYTLYINDAIQKPSVHLALFYDDTCIYCTDRKEGYALRKLQCGLTLMETWCECWTIKSMRIRIRQSISPSDVDWLWLVLHWMEHPICKLVKYHIIIFKRRIMGRRPKWLKPRTSEHLLESTPYSKVSNYTLTLNSHCTQHSLSQQ